MYLQNQIVNLNCISFYFRNIFLKNNYMLKKNKSDKGVDLNRNFGYMFGLDNFGSNDDPCKDDYRGSYAFSEPET